MYAECAHWLIIEEEEDQEILDLENYALVMEMEWQVCIEVLGRILKTESLRHNILLSSRTYDYAHHW